MRAGVGCGRTRVRARECKCYGGGGGIEVQRAVGSVNHQDVDALQLGWRPRQKSSARLDVCTDTKRSLLVYGTRRRLTRTNLPPLRCHRVGTAGGGGPRHAHLLRHLHQRGRRHAHHAGGWLWGGWTGAIGEGVMVASRPIW